MEEITEKLSEVKVTSHTKSAFLETFEDIIAYARELRGHRITDTEIDGTRNLAGPFTCGGLLILLLEPLQDHPWHRGVRQVVSDCPTLSALAEGVRISSNGTLSLIDDISILDLRPFICKKLKDAIENDQLTRVYDLVIEAICEKGPDVILCMGNEPRDELVARRFQLPHTPVIYGKHPSHAVNYNKDSVAKRKALFESVINSCAYLQNFQGSHLFDDGSLIFPPPQTEYAEDICRVIKVLCILIELCLAPPLRLPQLNLGSNGFYRLEEWHSKYFLRIQEEISISDSCQKQLTKVLAPIFIRLNRCIKPASWYLHCYKADWKALAKATRDGLPCINQLCDQLANDSSADGSFSSEDETDDEPDELANVRTAVIQDLEAIRSRLEPLLESMPRYSKRNAMWVEFAD